MDIHNIAIKKPQRTYVLRYAEGSEEQAVEEVMRWADDPSHEIDWQDAADISWRILNSVAADINRIAEDSAHHALKGGSQV
ncbi:MAG TPA: hypothetical protein PLK08_08640 [Phycisphaerae bacterium]|nr:hypothetical protein [Phycisphaerae bacterium]